MLVHATSLPCAIDVKAKELAGVRLPLDQQSYCGEKIGKEPKCFFLSSCYYTVFNVYLCLPAKFRPFLIKLISFYCPL